MNATPIRWASTRWLRVWLLTVGHPGQYRQIGIMWRRRHGDRRYRFFLRKPPGKTWRWQRMRIHSAYGGS